MNIPQEISRIAASFASDEFEYWFYLAGRNAFLEIHFPLTIKEGIASETVTELSMDIRLFEKHVDELVAKLRKESDVQFGYHLNVIDPARRSETEIKMYKNLNLFSSIKIGVQGSPEDILSHFEQLLTKLGVKSNIN